MIFFQQKVSVNGVKVVLPDVIVSNGVVQGIDFVFNVPASSVNMIEYLLQNENRFKDLTAALTLNNLLSSLEGQFVLHLTIIDTCLTV